MSGLIAMLQFSTLVVVGCLIKYYNKKRLTKPQPFLFDYRTPTLDPELEQFYNEYHGHKDQNLQFEASCMDNHKSVFKRV